MEYFVIIVLFVFLVAAFWFARVLDAANKIGPPPLPDNHPDRKIMEGEFNRALVARQHDADGDEWTDSVEFSEEVMEGENIRPLQVGRSYPLRFRKKDGTVRDYVSFTVISVQTLKSGELFYTGMDGCPTDPTQWRVVGMTHKQLLAVWASTLISPAVIVNMRDEIQIRNNPNL